MSSKNRLLEYCNRHHLANPEYTTLSHISGDYITRVMIIVDYRILTSYSDRVCNTKTESENSAAEAMLADLGIDVTQKKKSKRCFIQ